MDKINFKTFNEKTTRLQLVFVAYSVNPWKTINSRDYP